LTNLVDHHDIAGAAFGICRLHSLYNLDTDQLAYEGIIESQFEHKLIKSEPSVQKYSSKLNLFKGFENQLTPVRRVYRVKNLVGISEKYQPCWNVVLRVTFFPNTRLTKVPETFNFSSLLLTSIKIIR
jgi:hypothetical protein